MRVAVSLSHPLRDSTKTCPRSAAGGGGFEHVVCVVSMSMHARVVEQHETSCRSFLPPASPHLVHRATTFLTGDQNLNFVHLKLKLATVGEKRGSMFYIAILLRARIATSRCPDAWPKLNT